MDWSFLVEFHITDHVAILYIAVVELLYLGSQINNTVLRTDAGPDLAL